MDEMLDKTEQLKSKVVAPTEEGRKDAKQLIRIGKEAINNTDYEMIYSADLILTTAGTSINHFEERFKLSRDLNGVYAKVERLGGRPPKDGGYDDIHCICF